MFSQKASTSAESPASPDPEIALHVPPASPAKHTETTWKMVSELSELLERQEAPKYGEIESHEDRIVILEGEAKITSEQMHVLQKYTISCTRFNDTAMDLIQYMAGRQRETDAELARFQRKVEGEFVRVDKNVLKLAVAPKRKTSDQSEEMQRIFMQGPPTMAFLPPVYDNEFQHYGQGAMPTNNFGLIGVPQGLMQGLPVGVTGIPQNGTYGIPFGKMLPGGGFMQAVAQNHVADTTQGIQGQPAGQPAGNIASGSTGVKITIRKPRSRKARD